MVDIDRKDTLLATKKRKQLINQEWNTPSHRSAAMGQIVESTRSTLYDFSILFDGIDSHYRDRIFGDLDARESAELYDGVIDALAFFYELSLTQEGFDFQEMLQDAMDQVYGPRTEHRSIPNKKADVEFKVKTKPHIDQRTFEKAKAKFNRGAELSDREIATLVKWGGIEVDQMVEIIRERRQERHKERREDETLERINSRPDFGHFEIEPESDE